MSTKYATHDMLKAIIGANLVVSREDWGMRDMWVASLTDKSGFVIVQSLRHEEQDDAIHELMCRWREHKAVAHHVAFTIATPRVDSLMAVGA